MPTVQNVIEPKFANAEGTSIDCRVKFIELPDYVPFGATPFDPEPYGVQIYSDLIAGIYGPVAPYTPSGIPVVEAGGQ